MTEKFTLPRHGAKTETNIANKETPEQNFQNKYEALQRQYSSLKLYREGTFSVANLQSEGFQTLIKRYGAETVFNVIKAVASKKDSFSTYDVIKEIEKDSKKRSETFDEMKKDILSKPEKKNGVDADNNSYFNAFYGSDVNFKNMATGKIGVLKSLDSIIGKMGLNRDSKFLQSKMANFYNLLLSHRENEEILKSELLLADSDIFNLAEKRDSNAEIKKQQLRLEIDQLRKEIEAEILKIERDINQRLEEWKIKVLNDINNLSNFKDGESVVTDDTKAFLSEALNKAEELVIANTEKANGEISKKTNPLVKLITGLDELSRDIK